MSVLQAKAGIPKEIQDNMTEASKALSKGRNTLRGCSKRAMPEGLATVDEIEKIGLLSSHPLHKSTKVRALTLHSALPCVSCRYPCWQSTPQKGCSERALLEGLFTGSNRTLAAAPNFESVAATCRRRQSI